jgi:four helix bundle protein
MKNDREKFKIELKKRIYSWVLDSVKFIDKLPNDRTTDVISKQLLRSATSVGANYIEAQAAASKKDFTNFFHHSLKSANESKFWLAILRDSGKASAKDIQVILDEITEIANILGSSILTLKGKK